MTAPLLATRAALAAHFRARMNGIWTTEIEAQHRERNLDMMACNDSICRRAVEDADALLASGVVSEPATLAARVEADRDGFLDSPNLDRAWIAGWHSATDHHAARIRALAAALTEDPS